MLPGMAVASPASPEFDREENAMSHCVSPATALSIRIDPENPNHHLWNNNGTWFVHYTACPTPVTAERVRRSLGTRSLETARHRRDELFRRFVGPEGGRAWKGSQGANALSDRPRA